MQTRQQIADRQFAQHQLKHLKQSPAEAEQLLRAMFARAGVTFPENAPKPELVRLCEFVGAKIAAGRC